MTYQGNLLGFVTPPESVTFLDFSFYISPLILCLWVHWQTMHRTAERRMSHICYACINGYLPHRIFEAFLEIFTTLLRLCGFLGHSSKMGALADVNTHTLQLCKLWIVKAGDTKSCIVYHSCWDDSSFRLNSMGPLCLLQCFNSKE